MISRSLTRQALRTRARSVTVATTGSTTLVATADGYTRAAGSFLTDGFVEGLETTPSGFTQTDIGVVSKVEAGTLYIDGGRTPQTTGGGRTIVAGCPALFAAENARLPTSDGLAVPGRPYVTEQFVPATATQFTAPFNGGLLYETGLYVLTLFGPEDRGALGIEALIDAWKALFTPGSSVTAGSNSILVSGTTKVRDGQIVPRGDGWARCTLTIPWEAYTRNTVAA